MTAPRSEPPSNGKLILCAVLAVVLIAVLVWQPEEDAPGLAAGRERPIRIRKSALVKKTAPPAPTATPRYAQPRRETTLPDVLRFNPFAPPPVPLPAERAPELASESEGAITPEQRADKARLSWQAKRVMAIANGSGGAAALVEARVVRVGDVLDGFRVVAIRPDGLDLAPPESLPTEKAKSDGLLIRPTGLSHEDFRIDVSLGATGSASATRSACLTSLNSWPRLVCNFLGGPFRS